MTPFLCLHRFPIPTEWKKNQVFFIFTWVMTSINYFLTYHGFIKDFYLPDCQWNMYPISWLSIKKRKQNHLEKAHKKYMQLTSIFKMIFHNSISIKVITLYPDLCVSYSCWLKSGHIKGERANTFSKR